MRKSLGLLILFLVFSSQIALAEVLVLVNDYYIDQVTILQNDQGVIRYERRDNEYLIDSGMIAKVTTVVSAGLTAIAPEAVAMTPAPDVSEDGMTASEELSMDTNPEEEPTETMDVKEPAKLPVSEEVTPGIAGNAAEVPKLEKIKKQSFTLGFLNGGGSLVGLDYQALLGSSNVALQIGAGFIGWDIGVNYYFEPDMHSEYLSFAYWSQGGGDRYVKYLGVTYGFKAFGWLNGQIGLGYTLEVSEGMAEALEDAGAAEMPDVLLLYSIGVYF